MTTNTQPDWINKLNTHVDDIIEDMNGYVETEDHRFSYDDELHARLVDRLSIFIHLTFIPKQTVVEVIEKMELDRPGVYRKLHVPLRETYGEPAETIEDAKFANDYKGAYNQALTDLKKELGV